MNKKNLKKIAKILLIIFMSIIGLLVIGGIVLRILYPNEKLKHMAVEKLSQVLNNRKITLSDAQISIFSKIYIDDVKIYEPQSDSLFASVDKIVVTYDLTQIFRRHISVNEITIEHPSASIVQYSDSLFNFSDLIQPSSPDTTFPKKEESSVLPVSINLKKAEVTNVEFSYTKLDTMPGKIQMKAYIYGLWARLEDLNLKDISQISFSYQFGITPSSANINFSQTSTNIAIRANVMAKGKINQLSSGDAQIRLKFDQTYIALPHGNWDDVVFDLACEANFDLLKKWAKIDDCSVKLNSNPLVSLAGQIYDFDKMPPKININILPNTIVLGSLNKFTIPFFDFRYQGDLSFNKLRLAGGMTPNNPLKIDGEISVDDLWVLSDTLELDVGNFSFRTQLNTEMLYNPTGYMAPINLGKTAIHIKSNLDSLFVQSANPLASGYRDLTISAEISPPKNYASLSDSIALSLTVSLDSLNISPAEQVIDIKKFSFGFFVSAKDSLKNFDFALDSLQFFASAPMMPEIPVNNFSLRGNSRLNEKFLPEKFSINYINLSALNADVTSPVVSVAHPVEPQKSDVNGDIFLQNFALDILPIPNAKATGTINAEISTAGGLESLETTAKIMGKNIGYSQGDSIFVQGVNIEATAKINSNINKQHHQIQEFYAQIDSLITLSLSGEIQNFTDFDVTIQNINLNQNILVDYIPNFLPDIKNNLHLKGNSVLSGKLTGTIPNPDSIPSLNPLELPIIADLNLKINDWDVRYDLPKLPPKIRQGLLSKQVLKGEEQPLDVIQIKDLDSQIGMVYSPEEKSISANIKIAQVDSIKPLENQSIKGIKFELDAKLDSLKTFQVDNLALSIDDYKMAVNVRGEIYNLDVNKILATVSDSTLLPQVLVDSLLTDIYPFFSGQISVAPKDVPLSLPFGNKIFGSAAARFSLQKLYAHHGNIIHLDGSLGLDEVGYFLEPSLSIHNANGYFPFDYKLDVGQLMGMTAGDEINFAELNTQRDNDEINYWYFAPYETEATQKLHTIKIDQVKFDRYHMENINFNMALADNIFKVEDFGFDLYDGTAAGGMLFDPASGVLDNMTYRLYLELSGVDFGKLSGIKKKKGEEEKIFLNLSINGKGIDIEEKIDLEGEFNITQIGSDVSDRILHLLDPKGIDTSISATRWLIRAGWKPRYFNFRIKHGFLYPSIYMDQPWFSKYLKLFAIEQPIKYRRRPLEFFLEQAKAMKKKAGK